MQRRKFIAAAAATSITAPFASAKSISSPAPGDNEIYELRTYEMTWGDNQATRFDLEMHMWEEASGLSALCVFSTDLFERETIRPPAAA